MEESGLSPQQKKIILSIAAVGAILYIGAFAYESIAGGFEQPTEEISVVEESVLEESVEKKKPTESVKSNEPISAVGRKTKFTNKQMSGTFQGSQNIMDVTTAATIINTNIDGTFTYKDYIGSEFNGEGKGKYEIVMETEEEKDPFGQVTGTTYYHGIYFHSETEYGIRTSVYRIIDTDLLLPLKTTYFANQEAVMERKK